MVDCSPNKEVLEQLSNYILTGLKEYLSFHPVSFHKWGSIVLKKLHIKTSHKIIYISNFHDHKYINCQWIAKMQQRIIIDQSRFSS